MKRILSFINILYMMPFIMVLCTVFMAEEDSFRFNWFYFSMIGVVFATLFSYLSNQAKVKFSKIDFLVVLMSILTVLISFFSSEKITSGLIVFILLITLYFFLRLFLFQYKSNVHILTLFLIITAFFEAAWGLGQSLGIVSMSDHTITGSFSHSKILSGYLAIIFPMALFYVFNDFFSIKRKTVKRKNIYFFRIRWIISAISVALMLLILPIMECYASWITAICGGIFVILMYFRGKGMETVKEIHCIYHKIPLVIVISLIVCALSLSIVYYADNVMQHKYIPENIILSEPEVVLDLDIDIDTPIELFLNFQETNSIFPFVKTTMQDKIDTTLSYHLALVYISENIELNVILICLFIIVISVIYKGIKRKKTAATGALLSLSIFVLIAHPFNLLPFALVFVFLLALIVSEKHSITFYQDLQHCYFYDFRTRIILNKITVYCLLLILSLVAFTCLYIGYLNYSEFVLQ